VYQLAFQLPVPETEAIDVKPGKKVGNLKSHYHEEDKHL
jgi:hypothetical protein